MKLCTSPVDIKYTYFRPRCLELWLCTSRPQNPAGIRPLLNMNLINKAQNGLPGYHWSYLLLQLLSPGQTSYPERYEPYSKIVSPCPTN